MRARTVAWGLTLVLAFYLVVVAQRGLVLVRDGRPAFVLLGVGVLILPALGGYLVYRELRFGRATERLARRAAAAGAPSAGAGAAEDFATLKAAVEADPGDWRRWYAMALHYAAAGDVGQGRAAMLRAIRLERTAPVEPVEPADQSS